MARRSVLNEEETTEIDLSSMIDCIFILLIFFIVTTVFVEETGVQVAKPDAAASASFEKDEKVVFDITAENVVLLDGRKIALADIPSQLSKRELGADTPVVIRSHAKAAHGTFIAVWDEAKRGGAEALSFSTVH